MRCTVPLSGAGVQAGVSPAGQGRSKNSCRSSEPAARLRRL